MDQPQESYRRALSSANINWLQHFGSRCACTFNTSNTQVFNDKTSLPYLYTATIIEELQKNKYIWRIFTSSIYRVFQHLYSLHYIYSKFMKEQACSLFSLVLLLHNAIQKLRWMEILGLVVKGKYPFKQSKVNPCFAFRRSTESHTISHQHSYFNSSTQSESQISIQ